MSCADTSGYPCSKGITQGSILAYLSNINHQKLQLSKVNLAVKYLIKQRASSDRVPELGHANLPHENYVVVTQAVTI